MAEERSQIHCRCCGGLRLATRPAPTHIVHGLLTLFTGVWVFVWALLSLASAADGYRCNVCGWKAPGKPYVIWSAVLFMAMLVSATALAAIVLKR